MYLLDGRSSWWPHAYLCANLAAARPTPALAGLALASFDKQCRVSSVSAWQHLAADRMDHHRHLAGRGRPAGRLIVSAASLLERKQRNADGAKVKGIEAAAATTQ